jgi:butyrate kinase
MYQILVINPGSTSTKVAVFEDENEILSENIHHSAQQLSHFNDILGQFQFRLEAIESIISKSNYNLADFDAFVGRGGLLRPIPSGTYIVNDCMIDDLRAGVQGEHASNLGAILVKELGNKYNKPAFIVDPVVVDEMKPVARLSGHPYLPRKSIFHALNHKAVARKAAHQLNLPYEKVNLIIAHLGGGISIAAHCGGRVVDVNNALDAEGPFTPERSGTLPAGDLVRFCYNGAYRRDSVLKMIKGNGGMIAYLGTNDMRLVEKKIDNGDNFAALVIDAMIYQVSKEICSLAAVFCGKVDGIVLTGGIAHNHRFVDSVKSRCSFLAPIFVFPGEQEMEALALGALRILKGVEQAKEYPYEAARTDE